MLTSKGKVAKVVVCGNKGVGKTAILEQLVYGHVTPESEWSPTIEDTYVASVDTGRPGGGSGGGGRDTLRLFDTAGLQGSAQLPRHYLQLADGFVLVYDPHDTNSLTVLDVLRNEIERHKEKKEVAVVVVANMRAKQYRCASPCYNNSSGGAMDNNSAATHHPTRTPNGATAAGGEPVDADADGSAYAQVCESVLQQTAVWCARERLRHYTVNALERASLYEPFIALALRLHPPPTKSGFDHLRQLTHGGSKSSSSSSAAAAARAIDNM